MTRKARIAHLAGPNATIQNTPPLVTSNKARAKHGLPLLSNSDGTPARFALLRPQRLAAPATMRIPLYRRKPVPTAKVDPGLRRESEAGVSSGIN
jgi:L-asparaginase